MVLYLFSNINYLTNPIIGAFTPKPRLAEAEKSQDQSYLGLINIISPETNL